MNNHAGAFESLRFETPLLKHIGVRAVPNNMRGI
jgi:hypothetical protein